MIFKSNSDHSFKSVYRGKDVIITFVYHEVGAQIIIDELDIRYMTGNKIETGWRPNGKRMMSDDEYVGFVRQAFVEIASYGPLG